MALEELGTTFIKLGQAISTRSDLLPPAYIEELGKLQDAVPAIPYEAIREVIIDELGAPPEKLFGELSETPQAAASIAQVHAGRLRDGTPIVVKVQRPGTRQTVLEDLDVLEDIARFLTHRTQFGHDYDLLGWLEEFRFVLLNELDFCREGRNTDLFRKNFERDEQVVVPAVYWDLSTERVLTMERIEGVKIGELNQEYGEISREDLARSCARIVLTEILRDRFYHADPHPGNFFVLPGGRIGIIDLGMVGRLSHQDQHALIDILQAFSLQDPDYLLDELLVLGSARKAIDRRALTAEIDRIFQEYLDGPADTGSLARMLNDILGAAARAGIQLASKLIFLSKTIAICEGLADTLDPDFDLMGYSREFLSTHLGEIVSHTALKDRSVQGAYDALSLALDLPRKARGLLAQFERGEVTFVGRIANIEQIADHLHGAANRIAVAVVTASLIAGLSFLVVHSESRGVAQGILEIMLGIASVAAVGLLVSLWRSTRF